MRKRIKNMKSFNEVTKPKICMNCKHWLKAKNQHSERKTGDCRKAGTGASFVDKWYTTYADDSCKDFKKK